MKRTISRLLIISLMITPLAGCFGGGKKKRPPPPEVSTPAPPPVAGPTPPPVAGPTPPPTAGTRVEDQFGAGFAALFRAPAWSEPGDPKAGDIIPVSRDRDPVNF